MGAVSWTGPIAPGMLDRELVYWLYQFRSRPMHATEMLPEELAHQLHHLRGRLERHLPGFRFAETMAGHAEINGQRRDMEFQIEARATDPAEFLRSGRTEITGTVSIAGLVHDAALSGELWIRPLHRLIRYAFTFRDPAGRLLRFTGQKDLTLRHLLSSLTTLPGEVRDAGDQPVARAALVFPMKTLRAFLTSFRPLF